MTDQTSSARPARGRVSLFDLRWILTILFGVYGIVVTLMGLFAHAKTDTASGQDIGVNVNLWTGVPMLVVAIAFAVWALARPTFTDPGPGAVSPEGSADGTGAQG
ncbi:MAG TPA: hypothetical protein VHF06_18915 [Pseudonocardiaceae bacterium]|jgi:heme/copper-type cytochrome/quinol oxidase subunit 2|nr:hypothetical protein [Pseudonocardiaceae bacterium]